MKVYEQVQKEEKRKSIEAVNKGWGGHRCEKK